MNYSAIARKDQWRIGHAPGSALWYNFNDPISPEDESVSITLPPELHIAAQERAEEIGFDSVDEYVAYVLEQALSVPPPLPIARNQEELEALLLEGLQSGPAVEMTQKVWDDIRSEVRRNREMRKTRREAK